MFLMMGINDGRKDFNFTQMLLCGHCGRYGSCQVFMTFTMLWLFFIPVFRWNRHYYVQMSCCNALYELDPAVGKQIARGRDVKITQADLTYVNPGGYQAGYGGFGNGWSGGFGNDWNAGSSRNGGNFSGYENSGTGNDGSSGQQSGQRRCPSCGRMVDRSFSYCPHCGQRLG